jgi:hypothetical protein
LLVATAAAGVGCYRGVKATVASPAAAARMAELWTDPARPRDLFWGVGGQKLAPDPDAKYVVVEVKREGFSKGYTVVGRDKREWSVKFPPEAPTEVVASRILWGLGYHQPPIYYLERWHAEKAVSPNPQLPGRFREKDPNLNGLSDEGEWSYYENPFVGTRPMNGLLTLHVMLGNSDLKDQQNTIYTLKGPLEGATRWYVARDVGHTFGRTGLVDAPRGDIDVFEKTPFIRGVQNGKVQFEYSGRHRVLFENITPADVRWICDRLHGFTDRQWSDAFRAGGYHPATATRFIRRLKQKIDEGRALKD